MPCLILAFLYSHTCSSSCHPLVLQLLPVTPTHAPICQPVSLSLSTKRVPSDSACFMLPPCLPVSPWRPFPGSFQPSMPFSRFLCLAFPPQALQFSRVISYSLSRVYIAVRRFLHFSCCRDASRGSANCTAPTASVRSDPCCYRRCAAPSAGTSVH